MERIYDMKEADCRKCENFTGHSCKLYGSDAYLVARRCIADGFRNYKPVPGKSEKVKS